MKLLLYCTKAKPYLVDLRKLRLGFQCMPSDSIADLNGKIVAECDYEVEEIRYVEYADEWGYETNDLNEDDLTDKSCLSGKQLFDYLKHCRNGGYAIHIKNLHIFDKPKELRECHKKYGGKNYSPIYYMPITSAPQNMMKVKRVLQEDGILISIQPQWLCKILNGEKTIEVRRKVLKEVLK